MTEITQFIFGQPLRRTGIFHGIKNYVILTGRFESVLEGAPEL
jgi:hypothetical protein